MTTMSAAPTSATTLTPPSSSHGNEDPWIYAVGNHEPTKRSLEGARGPLNSHNGNSKNSPDMSLRGPRSNAPDLSPPYDAEDDEDTENNGENRRADGPVDENSKWIHRDKLARIENEELQAAGIMMPKGIPRPRKDRSTDRLTGAGRKGAESPERAPSQIARPKTRNGRDSISSFDPEKLGDLGDGQGSVKGGVNGSGKSRIPIPRFAPPASLPLDDPEPAPETRSRSKSTASLSPGTPPRAQGAGGAAKRSATTSDASPKKGTSTRKPPAKANSTSANRPKTRGTGDGRNGNAAKGANNNRSGELSPPGSVNKRPEGEPPWMVSAYKPDPRLPPDQQLLPTVARRLQQEKWEKEGKFGNIYDKEFRPLTDEGFLEPPEPSAQPASPTQPPEEDDPAQGDWPLKQEMTRSPTLNRGSSYSTMPKVQDAPSGVTPLGSPKSPKSPNPGMQRTASHTSNKQVIRVPDVPEPADGPAEKEKSGCGLCCIVM